MFGLLFNVCQTSYYDFFVIALWHVTSQPVSNSLSRHALYNNTEKMLGKFLLCLLSHISIEIQKICGCFGILLNSVLSFFFSAWLFRRQFQGIFACQKQFLFLNHCSHCIHCYLLGKRNSDLFFLVLEI